MAYVSVAMSALLFLILAQGTAQTEGKVPWLKDYKKALAAAKDSGKPIFIFFGCC